MHISISLLPEFVVYHANRRAFSSVNYREKAQPYRSMDSWCVWVRQKHAPGFCCFKGEDIHQLLLDICGIKPSAARDVSTHGFVKHIVRRIDTLEFEADIESPSSYPKQVTCIIRLERPWLFLPNDLNLRILDRCEEYSLQPILFSSRRPPKDSLPTENPTEFIHCREHAADEHKLFRAFRDAVKNESEECLFLRIRRKD